MFNLFSSKSDRGINAQTAERIIAHQREALNFYESSRRERAEKASASARKAQEAQEARMEAGYNKLRKELEKLAAEKGIKF